MSDHERNEEASAEAKRNKSEAFSPAPCHIPQTIKIMFVGENDRGIEVMMLRQCHKWLPAAWYLRLSCCHRAKRYDPTKEMNGSHENTWAVIYWGVFCWLVDHPLFKDVKTPQEWQEQYKWKFREKKGNIFWCAEELLESTIESSAVRRGLWREYCEYGSEIVDANAVVCFKIFL